MPELFEQTKIGSLELKNRFVRSATWSGIADEKGYVTDKALEVYGALAKGGVGLIVTGFQYVMPNGVAMIYQLGNYEDGQIEGLKRLTDTVHANGGKIVGQLTHTGAKANPKVFPKEGDIWGPSAVPDPLTGNTPREMTVEQIRQAVAAYAAAAGRCKQAGFDAVQLHGAHGYGFNQFLSPASNKRTDAYGGDIDNRYRILGEVMQAIRATVGDNFPVMIKLSGHDYFEGGLVTEDSLHVARRLVDDGIDAIEVSAGSRASYDDLAPSRLKIKKKEDEAYLLDLARRFKETVDVPIITIGGIRSFEVASEIINEQVADYVALCRPLIRQPDLINRWSNGDLRRATCISCNGCFDMAAEGIGICCKVDRALREKRAREG
jgi:2,4-dienoyl-CoA reductase-like NADH-dependent reductase (Old Yellow Enzyme family)